MARHLLVTNDYPPKTGGIQVYLHELWRRLEPGRAVVLTASSHPDAAAFDATSGVVIERVKAPTLILPIPRTLAAIEAAIERHQPDLVLLDPAWPLGLLGPRLSRPYGVVLHGAEVTIPGRLPMVASSLRYVLRHAEVAVCAGSYPEAEARRNAAEWMPPTIHVAPGVDTERFVPIDPSRRRGGAHFAGPLDLGVTGELVLATRAAQGNGHADPGECLARRFFPQFPGSYWRSGARPRATRDNGEEALRAGDLPRSGVRPRSSGVARGERPHGHGLSQSVAGARTRGLWYRVPRGGRLGRGPSRRTLRRQSRSRAPRRDRIGGRQSSQ